jgi:glycosyltransferase involved in cell wall biosynthesis
MDKPRITVITPTFNHGVFIERTIVSVLDQQYANLEFLVVDAGSLDDTSFVLREYERSLTWWESRRHEHIPSAINEALARATGGIVTILPAGDVLMPFALEEAARRFTAHGDAPRWVAGCCEKINEQDEPLSAIDWPAAFDLHHMLMHEVEPLPLSGAFFARSVFSEHGMMDEALTESYAYEFECRLLATGLTPRRLATLVASVREPDEPVDAHTLLTRGLEMIGIAERYADRLHVADRYDLWRSCDRRRRIYALAAAELDAEHARTLLWRHVARRPWWLTDETLRHMLVRGVEHAVPQDDRGIRRAA